MALRIELIKAWIVATASRVRSFGARGVAAGRAAVLRLRARAARAFAVLRARG